MAWFIDLTDQRYGRLVIKHRVKPPKGKRGVWWHCQCDCGRTHIASTTHLRNQHSVRSCGCLADEARKVNIKKHHRAWRAFATEYQYKTNSMRFHKAFVAIYGTLRYSEVETYDA